MSINDKVKVIWKTNCQWRDHFHWPKRKEIKPREGDTNEDQFLPLKPGDLMKIKFASRWCDVEVAEPWNPKSKKGQYLQLMDIFIKNIVLQAFSSKDNICL